MPNHEVGPSPRPGGPSWTVWVTRISGLLYFVVAGLLVYFRVGPFERVTRRLAERGTPVPGWAGVLFTAGVGLVAVLFAWKGWRLYSRARRR